MSKFEEMDEEMTLKTDILTDGLGSATASTVSDDAVSALIAEMQDEVAMEGAVALPDQGVNTPVSDKVGVTGVSEREEDEMEARLAALRAV